MSSNTVNHSTLNEGTDQTQPIFVFPPLDGKVPRYYHNSLAWGSRSAICLTVEKVKITDQFCDLKAITELMVKAILQTQPIGSFTLAGWSYGVTVALSVARHLESIGQVVDVILNIDSPPPKTWRRFDVASLTCSLINKILRLYSWNGKPIKPPSGMDQLTIEECIHRCFHSIGQCGHKELLNRCQENLLAHYELVNEDHFPRLKCAMVVFEAARHSEYLSKGCDYSSWNEYVSDITHYQYQGDHWTIFSDPHFRKDFENSVPYLPKFILPEGKNGLQLLSEYVSAKLLKPSFLDRPDESSLFNRFDESLEHRWADVPFENWAEKGEMFCQVLKWLFHGRRWYLVKCLSKSVHHQNVEIGRRLEMALKMSNWSPIEDFAFIREFLPQFNPEWYGCPIVPPLKKLMEMCGTFRYWESDAVSVGLCRKMIWVNEGIKIKSCLAAYDCASELLLWVHEVDPSVEKGHVRFGKTWVAFVPIGCEKPVLTLLDPKEGKILKKVTLPGPIVETGAFHLTERGFLYLLNTFDRKRLLFGGPIDDGKWEQTFKVDQPVGKFTPSGECVVFPYSKTLVNPEGRCTIAYPGHDFTSIQGFQ